MCVCVCVHVQVTVGFPNVGKSTIINQLRSSHTLADIPGTLWGRVC